MRPWEYYLVLESDLLACQRYVEFDERNMQVFSIEFMRLLTGICSEVEVLCKELCKRISPSEKCENIFQYMSIIEPALSLSSFAITDIKSKESSKPFAEWAEGKSPGWWRAHNDVKHDRSINYHMATLQHSIEALGGLFVLNLYSAAKAVKNAQLGHDSKLFKPDLGKGPHTVAYFPTITGYDLPHADKVIVP